MGRNKASYNIHDYVKYNNKSFNESGFNEIDGVVLTQLSNMDLSASGIDLYSGETKTISDIWNQMNTEGTDAHKAYLKMSKDERQLIEEMASSSRYSNLSLSNFVEDPCKNKIDGFNSVGSESKMEQFAAVTVTYEQDGQTYNYISYRATDGSTNGWGENLAMLYCDETQAQLDGKAYMNLVGNMVDGYIVGGGHSKGGGIFEYSYLFCDENIREKIVKGYVYDSPGLSDSVLSKTEYYDEYLKITEGSFKCPQDAIVGQLLHEGENAEYIYSVEKGFNQHDPYTWEINQLTNEFVVAEQTDLSKYVNEVLDNAVSDMTQEEKEAFFAFVSYLLENSGGEGIDGLADLFGEGWKNEDGNINWGKFKEIWDVLSENLKSMTPEERAAFFDSLGAVVSAFLVTTYDYLNEKIDDWIEKKKAEVKQKIDDVKAAVFDWIDTKKQQFGEFLSKVYQSFVTKINEIKEFFAQKLIKSTCYLIPQQIKLDTYKLTTYASRLSKVNGRINTLDRRLDRLYWQVGLQGLWNLMQADLLTGYNWRLNRCASYLNTTATNFNTVENKIKSSI